VHLSERLSRTPSRDAPDRLSAYPPMLDEQCIGTAAQRLDGSLRMDL
jgi:hypothetical protein